MCRWASCALKGAAGGPGASQWLRRRLPWGGMPFGVPPPQALVGDPLGGAMRGRSIRLVKASSPQASALEGASTATPRPSKKVTTKAEAWMPRRRREDSRPRRGEPLPTVTTEQSRQPRGHLIFVRASARAATPSRDLPNHRSRKPSRTAETGPSRPPSRVRELTGKKSRVHPNGPVCSVGRHGRVKSRLPRTQ